MTACKKASPGTIIEVADGNIFPLDGLGTTEVDLNQTGNTAKLVKMDTVAYVPGLSQNLLSTLKAVKQWGNPLIYYKQTLFWGSWGKNHSFFLPPQGVVFPNICEVDPESRGDADGDGESDRHNGCIPHSSASKRGENVANGRGNGNRDDRLVGTLRGVLVGEYGTTRHTKNDGQNGNVKRKRFFVDAGGLTKHSSLGGNSYAVMFVDDCTRFKVVKFVKERHDDRALVFNCITPQELSIKCMQTDNGDEFEREV